MRKIWGILLVLTLVMLIGSVVFASLGDFTGTWVNVTPNNGITKVVINSSGSNVTVQAFGSCSPSDCDWGTVSAKTYGTTISSALPSAAIALSADFSSSGIKNFLLIKRVGSQLQVEDLTTYTDGRSSRYSSYMFKRQLTPIGPFKTIKPGFLFLATPIHVAPPNGKQFDHTPRTTVVEWKPVTGAVSYTVEIDCFHCCQSNKWCTDVGQTYKIQTGITGVKYQFTFAGAQPGRWRVWAVGSGGQQSAKSAWWGFSYKD